MISKPAGNVILYLPQGGSHDATGKTRAVEGVKSGVIVRKPCHVRSCLGVAARSPSVAVPSLWSGSVGGAVSSTELDREDRVDAESAVASVRPSVSTPQATAPGAAVAGAKSVEESELGAVVS